MTFGKTIGAVIFLILVLGINFGVVTYWYPDLLINGRFQDIFAAGAVLFSGLAFLGVIYAILLQREELGLQRKELRLTRDELRRTAEAQEKSEIALSKQAEAMKRAAVLNGHSALLQLYTSRRDIGIARYGRDGVDRQWEDRATEVEQQIKKIISE